MKKSLGTMLAIMVVAILIVIFITAKYSTAEEGGRDGRFITYHNGTVLDTETNLMWAAMDNGKNINWADAKSYCEKYQGGGYSDWRMPTKDELKGLYDRSIVGNKGYHLTKLIYLSGCFVWASEMNGSDTYVFSFLYGLRYEDPQSRVRRNRALPVRYAVVAKGPLQWWEEGYVAPKVEAPAAPEVEEPLPVAQEVKKEEVVKPVIIEKGKQTLNVKFDFAKATIKKNYFKDIDDLAKVMKQYPDANIVIEGHTDNVDSFNNPENNIKLSQARANSIRQYLIDKFGIDASRLTAIGYGPNRPIASNDTEKGRQNNRRVEAVLNYLIKKEVPAAKVEEPVAPAEVVAPEAGAPAAPAEVAAPEAEAPAAPAEVAAPKAE